MPKYLPIQFDLIEEGEAAADVDREIRTAVDALYAHVQRCIQQDRNPKGAKATVNMKLTFARIEGDAYDIKCEISSKLPARPAHVTTAFEGVDSRGRGSLMVRASGSTDGDPRQNVLATGKGAAVVDGEPRPLVTPEPGGKRPAADRKTTSAAGE